jgi:hypothetical protein
MKSASANALRLPAAETRAIDPGEAAIREKLGLVAQAVIDLQQARHRADYDIGEPLDGADAILLVEKAISAFHAGRRLRMRTSLRIISIHFF